MVTEDIPRMFWRGRWRRASSAERYLQAAAPTVISSLLEISRATVARFASAADELLFAFQGVSTQVWTGYFLATS